MEQRAQARDAWIPLTVAEDDAPSIADETSSQRRVLLRKRQDARRARFRVAAREVSAAASGSGGLLGRSFRG